MKMHSRAEGEPKQQISPLNLLEGGCPRKFKFSALEEIPNFADVDDHGLRKAGQKRPCFG